MVWRREMMAAQPMWNLWVGRKIDRRFGGETGGGARKAGL